TSGYSRGRSATARNAGNEHDEGGLRLQGRGHGHDLGAVHRLPRKHDPPAAGHDAGRGREHGGLRGVPRGEPADWDDRQPDDGNFGRLAVPPEEGRSGTQLSSPRTLAAVRLPISDPGMLSLTLAAVLTLAASGEKPAQAAHTTRIAAMLIRAGAIYTMGPDRTPKRSIALGGGKVLAVGKGPHDLDALVGKDTQVIDDPSLTVLPGFIDTHTHLLFAADDIHDVPVGEAKNIAEFIELIRKRAATTPKGEWIRTSSAWNEWNLFEKRMPVASDLDKATSDHPVLVRRGGHNLVLNSYAMRLAGITRQTPTPKGGTIVKDAEGNPNGWLIDS